MADQASEKWNGVYEDVESSGIPYQSSTFLKHSTTMHECRRRLCTFYNLNLLFEIALVLLLVVLLASGSVHLPWRQSMTRSYGPTTRKAVVLGNTAGFGPDIVYNNHEMLWNVTEMAHIHRNWQQLFPKGRGYVAVSQRDEFEVLHPPFQMHDVLISGDHYEGHILAVYHQLHCLSILTTALGVSRQEWHNMDPKILEHRSHCVEYLRQSILCNGDTTLEGETGSWTKSTGWGQTHSCVDFDALTAWANVRSIWDLTDELLPESFDFTKADPNGGHPRHSSEESEMV